VLYAVGVDPAWTEDTDLTYSKALQVFRSLTTHVAGLRPYFAGPPYDVPEKKLPTVYNPDRDGYRAPPLVGIWASAPYLHNGSVPTLRDLFEYDVDDLAPGETARPPAWARVYDVKAEESYDFERVGLTVEIVVDMPADPALPYDRVESTEWRRIYDTSQPGKSNRGARTCGPNLKSKAEKEAVIEFLKGLDDATVRPE
jgi:hypothetical protein